MCGLVWPATSVQATYRFPGVRIAAERGVNEGVNEEGIVRMVHRSPRTSTRRIARRLRVPHTRVWRTLHAEGMYPYHVQRVQHLRPDDFAERLNFCKWLNGSRELHRYIMIVLRESRATATSAVHNRAAACVAAGGGIFENHL